MLIKHYFFCTLVLFFCFSTQSLWANCTDNLLQNSGFDSNLNHWTGQGGTIQNGALHLCNTGDVMRQTLAAEPGKTYQFHYTAKTLGTGQNVTFGIKFLDAFWTPIADNYSSFDSPNAFSSNFIEKIAPVGTKQVEVVIFKENIGCIDVDAVCLTTLVDLFPDAAVLELNSANSVIMDAQPGSFRPNTVDPNTWKLSPYAWTQGGVLNITRPFIQFELEKLPPNVTILEAELILFFNPDAGRGHIGENSFFIERIKEPWSDATITWVNQPLATTENGILVPKSNSVNQDYRINITTLVKEIVTDPNKPNYGFRMRLQTESEYRSVDVASSDYPNVARHPILRIKYKKNTACAASPIAHYTFSGNAQDGSGNNNNGTTQGATLTTDRHGKPNSAYAFDGNDFIEVPNSPSLFSPTKKISIAAWVYTESISGAFSVLCKSRINQYPIDYRFYYYGDNGGNQANTANILSDGAEIRLPAPLPRSTWFHVAITGDNGLYKLYHNGNLVATATANLNATPIDKNTNLFIGSDPAGVTEYHLGKLDEIRLYDCTLSAADIATIYQLENQMPTASCNNNLLQNSSFDSNLNNWNGQGGTIQNGALQLCQTGDSMRQTLAAEAGKNYQFHYTAKTLGTNQNVLFGIKFLDASLIPLISEYSSFDSPGAFSSNFIEKTAPAGTAYVEVGIIKENNGCVLIEEVCLTTDLINPPDNCTTSNLLSASDLPTSLCGAANFALKNLAAESGKTYTIKAKSYVGNSTSGFIRVKAMSSTWIPLADKYIYVNNTTPIDYSESLTSPSGTVWLEVAMGKSGNGCLFVSDICVQKSGPTNPVNGPDLELALSTPNANPGLWKTTSVTVKITNKGNQAATNISVQIPKQSDVAVSNLMANPGHTLSSTSATFNAWNGLWYIPNLAAGAESSLTYQVFTKAANNIPFFAQVTAQSPADVDSSPNNNSSGLPVEDDEALLALNSIQPLQKGVFVAADQGDARIYPNPVSRILNVDLSDYKSEKVSLILVDAFGRVVLSQEVAGSQSLAQAQMDVVGLENGLYFLRIEHAVRRPLVRRVVVEHGY